MINAAHLLLHSTDPPADRAFLRDVLGWPHVEDPGSEPGWLIFALPPTELGVHPTDADPQVTLHLMCDALQPTLDELAGRGVRPSSAVTDEGYGIATTLTLPSGAVVGLYEPRHTSPLAR
ncbi:MAG: extradiol dioxygenase [Actinomycetota bacterium]|nr:extradiol dioxygenase [Actinomycetota bacterium]